MPGMISPIPFSMKTLVKISAAPMLSVAKFRRVRGATNSANAATPESSDAQANGTSARSPGSPR